MREARFDPADIRALVDRHGALGLRSTASDAHETGIGHIEADLEALPGMSVTRDEFEVRAWLPEGGSLVDAGGLEVDAAPVTIAGAVPYSLPGVAVGDLLDVAAGELIDERARGRIVVRDFPAPRVRQGDLLAASAVPPTDRREPDELYDRPAFADDLIHADLLAAGAHGAAGLVIRADLPTTQLAGYFEPHKGTHYAVPAVLVGTPDAAALVEGAPARVAVRARVEWRQTRNVIATLPGLSEESIVLVTHTDGNTHVQDSGVAGLLALARHYSAMPVAERPRTLEFAFASAHLHISREGSARLADRMAGEPPVAVIGVEHLGARAFERVDGRLVATGDPEPMLWAVGPSPAMISAVARAVAARNLSQVAILHGVGDYRLERVPAFGSFGGIGSYFHRALIPTVALICGPWTLWAPTFGAEAIDSDLACQQLEALSDLLDDLMWRPSSEVAGRYPEMRAARAAGAPGWPDDHPPEVA